MKSLLYVVNTGTTAALESAIPLGSIIRRHGQCIQLNGSSITINKPGYYDVAVSASFTAVAAGNVGFELLADGVPVPGANASESITVADTQPRNMSFDAIVRVFCCKPVTLQVITNGAEVPTINSIAVNVKEI